MVRRPYFLPYYLNIVSAPADCLTKETFRHNGNTIKYLKSPSVERNAGDFQIKQMLQKNAAENRLKHKNVNLNNFIAYL